MQSWLASNLLLMSSAYPMPSVLIPSALGSLQLYDPVSVMSSSALGYALPVLLPTNPFHRQSSNEGLRVQSYLSTVNRQLILLWVISILSSSVFPYFVSLSLSILTGYGVNVFVDWLLLYSERENHLRGTPWAAVHLMLWTNGAFSLAPLLTRASLGLPRTSTLYINGASSSFPLFHPCWSSKERDHRP